MRFMFGNKSKIAAAVLVLVSMLQARADCAGSAAQFILSEDNCGAKIVEATSGVGTLTASADGINMEEIRWDDDPLHLNPRMQGKKLSTGWDKGGYWLIKFSSAGLDNLTFSADMYSSGKGPAEFIMKYSVNGIDFIELPESSVKLSEKLASVYSEVSLPDELSDSETVYIKLEISKDISVKGKSIKGKKDGSTYINNIIITGDGETEDKEDGKQPEPEKIRYFKWSSDKILSEWGKKTGKYIVPG
ncbi:MAG: hypothetical protein J6N52_04265 [Clostridia bacterium]|nr:hypothetical protein [Clostridia bacterium]